MHRNVLCLALIMMITIMTMHCGVCKPTTSNHSSTEIDDKEKLVRSYPDGLTYETALKLQQCESNTNTMELCMRCAKVTKSEIIYPMCCSNDDGIKDWCHDYVYYGRD